MPLPTEPVFISVMVSSMHNQFFSYYKYSPLSIEDVRFWPITQEDSLTWLWSPPGEAELCMLISVRSLVLLIKNLCVLLTVLMERICIWGFFSTFPGNTITIEKSFFALSVFTGLILTTDLTYSDQFNSKQHWSTCIWPKEHVKGWSRIRPPLRSSLLEVYITSQLWPPVWDDGKSLCC